MSGYTHGMFTLRVPPEFAQPISRSARRFGVSEAQIMLRVIALAADPNFLTDVLEYKDAPSPPSNG
jgi:hypothetical protein